MGKKEYTIHATVNVSFEINFLHKYPGHLTLDEAADQAQSSADHFGRLIAGNPQKIASKKGEMKIIGSPSVSSFYIKSINEENTNCTHKATVVSHFEDDDDEDEEDCEEDEDEEDCDDI